MAYLPALHRALRRLPGAAPCSVDDGPIRVGVVGLSAAAMAMLDRVLQRVSAKAPVDFVVKAGRGEVALVDAELAADLDDEQWSTLFGSRPVVAVVEPGAAPRPLRTPYRVTSAFDDGELLAAFDAMPETRLAGARRPPQGAPDPTLQDVPPFVAAVLRGWTDDARACVLAGHADGSSLVVDFARGEVQADPAAWERLQARRDWPQLADDRFEPAPLSFRARTHSIEALVWSLGLACGDLPLLGAPAAWRQATLDARNLTQIESYSNAPAHLHLIKLLGSGIRTPAAMRRASHVDERELRAFLQAGLFLRLLQWSR